MPADDGLHGMSAEDLAAFLQGLRALREREGLGLDGSGRPPGSGPRRGRWRPGAGLIGITAVALTLAGLAAGGVVLTDPAGHSETSAPGAVLPDGGRSMADHGGRMHMHMRTEPAAPTPARPAPSSPAAQASRRPRVRIVVPVLVRPARMGTEVAGVGCPGSQNDGVSLAAASTGPGWATAGGGWSGNGCDGSSVWTMDPDDQASPSTLTWFFYPSMRAAACRLGVFVPSRNALGVGSYQITAGSASLGTVSVDQAGSAGQWVTLGSYPASGMLTVQLQPGTATLTAASGGNGGNGQGGNGNSGNGGNGGSGNSGPGGKDGSGHNAAVAASAARASCH
jgi:hypothetical protein